MRRKSFIVCHSQRRAVMGSMVAAFRAGQNAAAMLAAASSSATTAYARGSGVPRVSGSGVRLAYGGESGVQTASAALGRGTYVSRAARSAGPANRSFTGSAARSCVRAPRRHSPAAPRSGLRPAPAAGRRGLVHAPAEPRRAQPATPPGPAPKGHAPVHREPACHPGTSNHACPYFGSRPFTGAGFGGDFLPFPNGP